MRSVRHNALRRVAASLAILLSSLAGAAGVVASSATPASAAGPACPSPAAFWSPNSTCYVIYSWLEGPNHQLATTAYVGETVYITSASYILGTNTLAMPSGTYLGTLWKWGSVPLLIKHPTSTCAAGINPCEIPVVVTRADLGQTLEWQTWGYDASGPWICSAVTTTTAETGTIQVVPPTVSIQATPTSLQVDNYSTVVATGHNVPPGGYINLWAYPNSNFTSGTQLGRIDNVSGSAATFQLPVTQIRQTPQTVWYRATVSGPVNAPTYADTSVTWMAPTPTVSVSANPTSLTSGQTTTVTGSATNVPTSRNLNVYEYSNSGASASGGGTFVASCPGNGQATETCSGSDTVSTSSSVTHYYQAFISGLFGSNVAHATWTAPPQSNVQYVSVSASPTNLTSGQTTTVTGSATNVPTSRNLNVFEYPNPGASASGGGTFVASCPGNGQATETCTGYDTASTSSSVTHYYQAFISGVTKSGVASATWISGGACTSCPSNPSPTPSPTTPTPPPINGSLSLSASPGYLGRPCRYTQQSGGGGFFTCTTNNQQRGPTDLPSGRSTTLTASATFAQNGGAGPLPGSTVTFTVQGIDATNRYSGAAWTGPLSQRQHWGAGTVVGSCTLPSSLPGGQCSITVPYLPYEGTQQVVTFQAQDGGSSSSANVTWMGDYHYYT